MRYGTWIQFSSHEEIINHISGIPTVGENDGNLVVVVGGGGRGGRCCSERIPVQIDTTHITEN